MVFLSFFHTSSPPASAQVLSLSFLVDMETFHFFSPLLKELFLICHVMKLVLAEILSWKSQAAWGDAIVLPTARRASRTR